MNKIGAHWIMIRVHKNEIVINHTRAVVQASLNVSRHGEHEHNNNITFLSSDTIRPI